MKHFLPALFLATTITSTSLAQESASKDVQPKSSVQSKTLANGLTVMVKEDHRAPTVGHSVWYKVGSIDEPDGRTGISHLLEHMMFRGTQKVTGEEFTEQIAEAGGRDNAFTSKDYTFYLQLAPKEALKNLMILEADRMVNLLIDKDAFEKERQVVIEERRLRTDDNHSARFWERLQALSYMYHPYRQPIIGWRQDLQKISVSDLYDWYHQFYSPQNATVIVVGDVNPEAIFQWAEEIYGVIPSSAFSAPSSPPLPDARDVLGNQRFIFKAPTSNPELIMAYHAPVLKNPQADRPAYALAILSQILSGHSSARLGQTLIKDSAIASHVYAYYRTTQRGPSQFIIAANPSKDVSGEQLEEAIRDQLNQIIENKISQKELDRAKRQLKANRIYSRDSLYGQLSEIGRLVSRGFSHEDLPLIDEKLQQVTLEDIQSAAQSIFKDERLIVGIMLPNGQEPSVEHNVMGNSNGSIH